MNKKMKTFMEMNNVVRKIKEAKGYIDNKFQKKDKGIVIASDNLITEIATGVQEINIPLTSNIHEIPVSNKNVTQEIININSPISLHKKKNKKSITNELEATIKADNLVTENIKFNNLPDKIEDQIEASVVEPNNVSVLTNQINNKIDASCLNRIYHDIKSSKMLLMLLNYIIDTLELSLNVWTVVTLLLNKVARFYVIGMLLFLLFFCQESTDTICQLVLILVLINLILFKFPKFTFMLSKIILIFLLLILLNILISFAQRNIQKIIKKHNNNIYLRGGDRSELTPEQLHFITELCKTQKEIIWERRVEAAKFVGRLACVGVLGVALPYISAELMPAIFQVPFSETLLGYPLELYNSTKITFFKVPKTLVPPKVFPHNLNIVRPIGRNVETPFNFLNLFNLNKLNSFTNIFKSTAKFLDQTHTTYPFKLKNWNPFTNMFKSSVNLPRKVPANVKKPGFRGKEFFKQRKLDIRSSEEIKRGLDRAANSIRKLKK